MFALWFFTNSIVHTAMACSNKGNNATNNSVVGSTNAINEQGGPGNPGKTPQTPNGGGGPDIPGGPDRPGGGGGGGGPPGTFATCPGQPPFVIAPRSPGVPTTWKTYKYKAPPEMLAPSTCEFEFPTYSTLHNHLDIIDDKKHLNSTGDYKRLMKELNHTRYRPCGFFDKERKPRTGKCSQLFTGFWEVTAHFVLKLNGDPNDECLSCIIFLNHMYFKNVSEPHGINYIQAHFDIQDVGTNHEIDEIYHACFCYRRSLQVITQRDYYYCYDQYLLLKDLNCRNKDGELSGDLNDGNWADSKVENKGVEMYFGPGEVTVKVKANHTDADWQVATGYIFPARNTTSPTSKRRRYMNLIKSIFNYG